VSLLGCVPEPGVRRRHRSVSGCADHGLGTHDLERPVIGQPASSSQDVDHRRLDPTQVHSAAGGRQGRSGRAGRTPLHRVRSGRGARCGGRSWSTRRPGDYCLAIATRSRSSAVTMWSASAAASSTAISTQLTSPVKRVRIGIVVGDLRTACCPDLVGRRRRVGRVSYPARTTHRKPRCPIDVSMDWACRAAGR
jgi:hypothetical protein